MALKLFAPKLEVFVVYEQQFDDWQGYKRVCVDDNILRPNHSEILIAPCHHEHWISTDLYKIRLYCEKHNIRLVSFGSTNQFPFLSIFSNDVVITDNYNPVLYSDGSTKNNVCIDDIVCLSNYEHTDEGCNCEHCKDRDVSEIRKKAREEISDQDVIERFWRPKVFVKQTSLDRILSSESLNSSYSNVSFGFNPDCKTFSIENILICEFKKSFSSPYMKYNDDGSRMSDYLSEAATRQDVLPVEKTSVTEIFQQKLLELINRDDYMTLQILGSSYFNWQFICSGGSSNLFCMLPIKCLMMCDQLFNNSVSAIVRGIARKRYGSLGEFVPIIGKYWNCDSEGLARAEFLKNNLDLLSQGFIKVGKFLKPEIFR